MAHPGRSPKLTPEVQQSIVAQIEDGAWDYVAAENAGIGQRTFYRWLEDGAAGKAPYWQFRQAISAARAQARARAERRVLAADPFKWLRYGPGRERPGQPGWTDSQQVTGTEGGPVEFTITIAGQHGDSDADPE